MNSEKNEKTLKNCLSCRKPHSKKNIFHTCSDECFKKLVKQTKEIKIKKKHEKKLILGESIDFKLIKKIAKKNKVNERVVQIALLFRTYEYDLTCCNGEC